MAGAIDPDDYSGSEFEFEPEDSAGQSTNNDSDGDNNDSKSGPLSLASAARTEELARELNAVRKGKAKKRSSPSGRIPLTFSTESIR